MTVRYPLTAQNIRIDYLGNLIDFNSAHAMLVAAGVSSCKADSDRFLFASEWQDDTANLIDEEMGINRPQRLGVTDDAGMAAKFPWEVATHEGGFVMVYAADVTEALRTVTDDGFDAKQITGIRLMSDNE